MEEEQHRGSSSSRSGSINRHLDSSGKYVRYTAEQIEALETIYNEFPKPSSSRRQQLISEWPVLANIEPKHVKVWFQNRRCRDKQRKKTDRLESINLHLSATNKLLIEENNRLNKRVWELTRETAYIRHRMQSGTVAHNGGSCESVGIAPQHSLRDTNNSAGFLFIVEETLSEFLPKVTGTSVDWVQMPGMKPGSDSVGIFYVSHGSNGVAARACGHVNLEPRKIVEILKDRPCFYQDCRSLQVVTTIPTSNGGSIELVNMQTYAPTTLSPARDFWTLRYTNTLENGSLVVCERSLPSYGTSPNAGVASQFVRAEILPSGYVVQPCHSGGSIIHIVDHVNLEAGSVPEVLRPLYESSRLLAQRMTIAALQYLRQIAQETSGEVSYEPGRQPPLLRAYSNRLSRGFNDAINGFNDDGWSLLNFNGAEDVIVTFNPSKSLSSSSQRFPLGRGVLCAKTSILLENVPPAVLVQFLRRHRSEWADFSVDAYCADLVKDGSFPYSGIRPTRFTGSQSNLTLGHAVEHEEILEVVRLEGQTLGQPEDIISRDIHLLQMCSGVDESAVGACFEVVFAPVDQMFPNDPPLLPSGFRIIPLDTKSGTLATYKDLNPISGLEVGSTSKIMSEDASSSYPAQSFLVIAFQFPVETNLVENVAAMACQYVRSVISAVQRVVTAISPSQLSPSVGSNLSLGSPEALTLANWVCQSYSVHVGGELLWDQQNAILCYSLKSLPVFVFANQAGLNMMETSLETLQDITLDKIFGNSGRTILFSEIANIMQQGSACLPGGICLSTMGRRVSYDRAIAWKVLAGDDDFVHCLAISFVNWSFVN